MTAVDLYLVYANVIHSINVFAYRSLTAKRFASNFNSFVYNDTGLPGQSELSFFILVLREVIFFLRENDL